MPRSRQIASAEATTRLSSLADGPHMALDTQQVCALREVDHSQRAAVRGPVTGSQAPLACKTRQRPFADEIPNAGRAVVGHGRLQGAIWRSAAIVDGGRMASRQ